MFKHSAISRLIDLNLLVYPCSDSASFAGGYEIAKPQSVEGNTRVDYEFYFGDEDILCDAPSLSLYPKNNMWILEVWEYVPGPGPGDFQLLFEQIDDAILSVIDYYFGDPSRMNSSELLNL